MSALVTVVEELEKVARDFGWSIAVADKTQDTPEQHRLILTHALPKEQPTLGMHVTEDILAADLFGGVPGGEQNV